MTTIEKIHEEKMRAENEQLKSMLSQACQQQADDLNFAEKLNLLVALFALGALFGVAICLITAFFIN